MLFPLLMALGGKSDPLNAHELSQVADAVDTAAVQACFEEALERDPYTTGRVEVAWVVAKGETRKIQLKRDTTGDDAVASCLTAAIEAWPMPAELDGSVLFPFVLITPNRNPVPVRASVKNACETKGVVFRVVSRAVVDVRGLESGVDGCDTPIEVELSGVVEDGVYTLEFQ